ncbi:Lrp/AsnC family transcriptional regulator [Pelagibius sp. Alg239-R121]|uniref:Lrp/AsnC family transcriptional regulator n=1 Tax=Pelagibius sp. Alg239-R121 TaxID=2993448 RepID=UPI0024A6803F|nr:Lrp/AsnC family transcriptional regulator [Pelagibius sp. Alg239-R121]
MPIDEKDLKLLELLKNNAREPTSSIARKLGVSRSTIQSRIERLERSGIINGYTLRMSDEYERSRIKAHVMISVAPKLSSRVAHSLQAVTELTALYAVSGPYDLIAVLSSETTERIDALLDEIGALPGIRKTTSSIILSTKFSR